MEKLKRIVLLLALSLFLVQPLLAADIGLPTQEFEEVDISLFWTPTIELNLPSQNLEKQNLELEMPKSVVDILNNYALNNQEALEESKEQSSTVKNSVNSIKSLLDLQRTQLTSLRNALMVSNNNYSLLNEKYAEAIKEIDESLKRNEEIRAAIISNNEDYGETLILWGEAMVELEKEKKDSEKYVLLVNSLEKQVENGWIGFATCGSCAAIGGGILTSGIIHEDYKEALAGASTVAISTAIWFIGHRFKWW